MLSNNQDNIADLDVLIDQYMKVNDDPRDSRPNLSWLLTDFDVRYATEANWLSLPQKFVDTGKIKYIGAQLERCPTTHRLHVQCFVKFITKVRKSFIQKITGTSTHCKYVEVEHAEAINYGLKLDTRVEGPFEFGIKPKAVDRSAKGGQRTKEQWEEVRKVIVSNDRKAVPVDLVIKHNLDSRFDRLKAFWTDAPVKADSPAFIPNDWGLLMPYANIKQKHYWIFSSAPNRGKTTFAKRLSDKYCCYIKSSDFTYWNIPRDPLSFLILDDYNYAGLKWHSLNQICDGTYEFRVFQGGVQSITTPFIVIVLSNLSIKDIYPYKSDTLYARFKEFELV